MTLNRRLLVGAGAAMLAAPGIGHAEVSTLRITGWGGKWGEVLKASVIPEFEKSHSCKVEVDTAFPFIPKLQASGASRPIYDVLHANTNEQWMAVGEGLVVEKITAAEVPRVKDLFPYATSDKVAGVIMFTNAIGLGYRTDKGFKPTSWKDMAEAKFAGQRGGFLIPVNSLGMMHLMMLGKVYGAGLEDLDAAYKALEQLKPIKLVDFTAPMEKMLQQGEVVIGVLHDSGIFRYDGQNLPIGFCAPSEGVVALEQVLNVTSGSQVKALAYAWIDHMLSPVVQKTMAEAVWYAPANRTVQLEARQAGLLFNTPEKVAQLIQVDWKWYNARKDAIDARVARIMRA